MRISDWSSDVCSSDLIGDRLFSGLQHAAVGLHGLGGPFRDFPDRRDTALRDRDVGLHRRVAEPVRDAGAADDHVMHGSPWIFAFLMALLLAPSQAIGIRDAETGSSPGTHLSTGSCFDKLGMRSPGRTEFIRPGRLKPAL